MAGDAQQSFAGPAEPVRLENPTGTSDFDSWMQAYACIVSYGDDWIMLYKGDDFGRAGFGWARMSRTAQSTGGTQ